MAIAAKLEIFDVVTARVFPLTFRRFSISYFSLLRHPPINNNTAAVHDHQHIMAPLTGDQIWICAIAERISSSISVTATLLMFICYFSLKRFRSLLSNRLLIFASVANLACNAATLMGGSGLLDVNSSVCQTQAFLLEWYVHEISLMPLVAHGVPRFMQTDPLFGTCMAVDVYLVIFRRWTYGQVKKIFKWYIPLAFGIPFIPALFCLVYRDKNHKKIYGNAGVRFLSPSNLTQLTT